MTALAPSSTALVIAIVMPRSLNDPVGLAPSTFRWTSQPVRRDSSGAGSSGVAALPQRDHRRASSLTGSRSRYSSISPGQPGDTRH